MKGNGKKILIVEDDPSLLRGIGDYFQSRGYRVDRAEDGETGLQKALNRNGHDLIVLDVMLPGINGYEICRYLRQEEISTPIIFLTAKSEESDILLGLGLGADDYLAKPFSIRVLVARVEAIMRRSEDSSLEMESISNVRFGEFELDRVSRKLRYRNTGNPIKLSPREYELLSYFLDNAGSALSRDQIMNAVWGYDVKVTPRSVDRFVTTLRKKIETNPGEFIETVREFGYRFRR